MANFSSLFLSFRHNNKHLVCASQLSTGLAVRDYKAKKQRVQNQIHQWRAMKTNLQIHGRMQRAQEAPKESASAVH